MPIYEYECNDNRHRFEKWQSIQDEPIKTCPVCGGPVHKIFHPAGIIFKGSGWYITDNRKSTGTSSTSTSAKSTSLPESKSETKSDKPASTGSDKKD